MGVQRVMAGLAGVVIAASPGLGVGAEERGDGKAGAQPVLVMEHAGLDAWLEDPRDRAFAEALHMLPDRVRELPRAIDDLEPEQAGLIELALRTAFRPAHLAITYNPENASGGAFGYGLAVSLDAADRRQASELHATMGSLLRMAEAPVEPEPSGRWEGMTQFVVPGAGLVTYGPREAAGGWRYEVMVGSVDDPEAGVASLAAVDGVEPIVRGRFDAAGLKGALQLWGMFAGPGQRHMYELVTEQMAAYGLAGESPISVDFYVGRTEEAMVSRSVTHGARAHREAWYMPDQPLTRADLGAIPSDAMVAWMGKTDWRWVDETLDRISPFTPEVRRPLERFEAMTGVDLIGDVVGSLEGTVGCYVSDSTGGGGLLSSVVLLRVEDEETLGDALATIVAHANTMASGVDMGPGAIRLSSWTHAEREFVSLRFPGLPVPVEPTWTMAGDWLVIAPSAQAALAASRQATGAGDDGLWANERFAADVPGDLELISVAFADSETNGRMGYWATTLLGTAVANAVRSPIDPERDPGLIVPPFHELLADARPTVEVIYWDGDALVTEVTSDRSLLATTAIGIGTVGHFAPLFALPGVAEGMERMSALDGAAPWTRALAWQSECLGGSGALGAHAMLVRQAWEAEGAVAGTPAR